MPIVLRIDKEIKSVYRSMIIKLTRLKLLSYGKYIILVNSPTFPGVKSPGPSPPKNDLDANIIDVSGQKADNNIFHFKLLRKIHNGTVNKE